LLEFVDELADTSFGAGSIHHARQRDHSLHDASRTGCDTDMQRLRAQRRRRLDMASTSTRDWADLNGCAITRPKTRIVGVMGTVPLEALDRALRLSWSAETSAATEWTSANQAKGQCAVTACVVQDYLGGDILNTITTMPDGTSVSHYFNLIAGEPVDLTEHQFPPDTRFSEPAPKTKGLPSTRAYCLSYEHTNQRYQLLRKRVAAHLQGKE
jgi:hypothetical protein